MHDAEQWLAKVESLTDLWRCVRVACVCVQTAAGWANLLGRVELATEASEDGFQVSPVIQTAELLGLYGHLHLRTLPNLIENLKAGKIFSGSMPYPISLFLEEQKPGNWEEPRLLDRTYARRDFGLDFPTFVTRYWGPEVYLLLSRKRWDEIDANLALHDPPFDGVAGLARTMGFAPLSHSGDRSYLYLCAPIPVRFKSIAQHFENTTLSVKVEAHANVDPAKAFASAFYSVDDQSALALGNLSSWTRLETASVGLFEKTIALKHTKGVIKLLLAYADTQVELHEHYLSSINPWVRACEFFDPQLENLTELVRGRGQIKVNTLEMGALRLFGTAGLRTAWFGKKAAERKSDILAGYLFPDGRTTLLVVECTEENPTAKVTKVAHEAEALRKFLAEEPVKVIPVVYTPNPCSSVEWREASSHNVALVGKDETDRILRAVRSGGPPEAVLNVIQSHVSSLGVSPGEIWPEIWR